MGIIQRKVKLVEFRRSDIIEAAERVFFSKGYTETTMDDIAKEAEYSKRTIYTYFTSKKEIYFEIMLKGFRILNSLLQSEFGRGSLNGIEKIRILGESYFNFAVKYPGYMQAIIEYETSEKDIENEDKDSLIRKCYTEGEKSFILLTEAIREGIEQGDIIEGIDVVDTAISLWSSIIGFITLARKKDIYLERQYGKSKKDLFEATFELVIRSLKK